LVCGICRFSVLTSKGYDDATKEAQRFGIIGPAEIDYEVNRVIYSDAEPRPEQFGTQQVYSPSNTAIQELIEPVAISGTDKDVEPNQPAPHESDISVPVRDSGKPSTATVSRLVLLVPAGS
jgi:hypothetical protein